MRIKCCDNDKYLEARAFKVIMLILVPITLKKEFIPKLIRKSPNSLSSYKNLYPCSVKLLLSPC